MKIVLIVSLVAIPSLLGLKKARKFELRECILREGITLFSRVESEIKYNLTPLPNAIEVARQDFSTFFKDILGDISLAIIDNKYNNEFVIDKINQLPTLKIYDKQVISNGITSLGNSDIDTQLKQITNTINTLLELQNEAKEDKFKNSKLYRTLGIITGLMLAIVII